jgi:hypothetical protein
MPNNARRRFIKTVLLASGATFLNWNDVLALGARGEIHITHSTGEFGLWHGEKEKTTPLLIHTNVVHSARHNCACKRTDSSRGC